jgi:ABC-2 type transport system ATP-binding protein
MFQNDNNEKFSIKVGNLTKKFGNITAVDNITFSVKRGETFAFLGPNGAGKTTTIKMLTTLLHPTTGTMFVNGYDPISNQDSVRRSFGIVFQDQSLDEELTAYENMEFHGVLYKVPDRILKKKIEELLIFVELWDRKNDLVKHFSGGMKRRLEIARGLLHTPEILFMDEPTIGLDPQTRNHIWKYLKDLNGASGITVFFTTHYMDEAERVADRVAIIDHGKIVAEDSPEELKKRTGAKTLEEAFLSLTGKQIREEEAGSIDQMRMNRRMWSRQ